MNKHLIDRVACKITLLHETSLIINKNFQDLQCIHCCHHPTNPCQRFIPEEREESPSLQVESCGPTPGSNDPPQTRMGKAGGLASIFNSFTSTSRRPPPCLILWYKKCFSCLLALCCTVSGNVPFYLDLQSNSSMYAKTVFLYFLVWVYKSLSQMCKNPMTSGER